MPKGQYDRRRERPPTSIPSIIEICQQIPDESTAIDFLTSHAILPHPKDVSCISCGYKGTRPKSKSTPKSLKCNKHICGKSQSLLQNTIYAKSRLALHKMIYLSIFWLFQSPTNIVKAQIHCSAKTVSDFYKLFNAMVCKRIELDSANDGLGGVEDELGVILWREKHIHTLWPSFLEAVKRLRYTPERGFEEIKEGEDRNDAGGRLNNDDHGPNPPEVLPPTGLDMNNGLKTGGQQSQPSIAVAATIPVSRLQFQQLDSGAATQQFNSANKSAQKKKQSSSKRLRVPQHRNVVLEPQARQMTEHLPSPQQHNAVGNGNNSTAISFATIAAASQQDTMNSNATGHQMLHVMQHHNHKQKEEIHQQSSHQYMIHNVEGQPFQQQDGVSNQDTDSNTNNEGHTQQQHQLAHFSFGEVPRIPPLGDGNEMMHQHQQQANGLKRSLDEYAMDQGTNYQNIHSPQQQQQQQHEEEEVDGGKKRAKKVHSIPSFMDIVSLIPCEGKAIEFLTKKGIFTPPKDVICSHCGYQGFRAKGKKTPKSLKCNRCNKCKSLMKNTFFEGAKAPLQQILYMAVFWLSLSSASTVITQLRCSSATVTEFSDKFRRVIQRYMLGPQQGGGSNPLYVQKGANIALLKPHMPKFSRKNQADEHFYAAVWRERNINTLWDSFLLVLQTMRDEDTALPPGGNDEEVWINEESCKACCKYHQRLHNQKKQEELQTQRRRELLERSAEVQQKQQADIHAAI